MRLDLSSQIVLDRVSPRYYRPENEFELSALTRFEKVPTKIYESSVEASLQIARNIAKKIEEKNKKNSPFVLGLPGGHSPQTIYSELVRMHKEEGLSFKNVIVFNIYEFYPLTTLSNSNLKLLKELLLDHIDIDPKNIYSPDGFTPKEEIINYCREYERTIQNVGGIDYLLLGLGRAGNIGINIAGSSMSSQTRLILLDDQSKKEAINTFGSKDLVPPSAITMGVSTIMKAKEIALIAWGEDKAKSIKDVVEGVMSDAIPASSLQAHTNAHIYRPECRI